MKEFDSIVGYAGIKQELARIADVLRCGEPYAALGVKAPRGLMLHGDPGLGKTLMANCLIKASGRPVFICRRDLPNGEFIIAIKEAFTQARRSAPSIVFLDDMDKFANSDTDHQDAPEYVTVQSCIDEAQGEDIFILATANNLHKLPRSLRRAGRFDRMIELDAPGGEDAVAIIEHYLQQKPFATQIEPDFIARLMIGRSCAEIETVINEAGIYAGFERSDTISNEHFMKACLKTIHDMPSDNAYNDDDDDDGDDEGCGGYRSGRLPDLRDSNKIEAAYHEAGHAVIHEIMDPGSTTLIAICNKGGDYNGFTSFVEMRRRPGVERNRMRILAGLGGMAAVEQKLGGPASGAVRDLDRVFDLAMHLVGDDCVAGLQLHCNGNDSQELKSKREVAAAAEVERSYRQAKEILAQNAALLDAIADILLDVGMVSMYDIQRLKAACEIVPAAV